MSDTIAYSDTREAKREYEARYRARLKADPERAEKKRAVNRQWRRDNPEKRTLYGKAKIAACRVNKPWLLAFKTARRRAYKYKMEFALTQEWVKAKYELGSPLSGLPFSGEIGPFSPSIDRIDSNLAYTPENCRLVLLAENLFKNQWHDGQIIEIAKAIAARHP
jgi:hypothetical protein